MAEEISDYIIELFESISTDFRVLSKSEVEELREASEDLYAEYVALLREYQDTTRIDEDLIATSEEDQNFEDLDIKVTPAEEEGQAQTEASEDASQAAQIAQLNEADLLDLLKKQTITTRMECEEVTYPSKDPTNILIKKSEVDANDPKYVNAENQWTSFKNDVSVTSAAKKNSFKKINRDGDILYKIYNLTGIHEECVEVTASAIEDRKKSDFKTKYNR